MPDLDENNQADNVPLESVHWNTLRKMVEEKGGKWTNKEEAIAFLRGAAPAAETPPPDDMPPDDDAANAAPEAKAAPAFNPALPHGQVSGDIPDAPGARFMQHGRYYNALHEVVGKV